MKGGQSNWSDWPVLPEVVANAESQFTSRFGGDTTAVRCRFHSPHWVRRLQLNLTIIVLDDHPHCIACLDRPFPAKNPRISVAFSGQILVFFPLTNSTSSEKDRKQVSRIDMQDWPSRQLGGRKESVSKIDEKREETGCDFVEFEFSLVCSHLTFWTELESHCPFLVDVVAPVFPGSQLTLVFTFLRLFSHRFAPHSRFSSSCPTSRHIPPFLDTFVLGTRIYRLLPFLERT